MQVWTYLRAFALLAVFSAGSMAQASISCEIVSGSDTVKTVAFYAEPTAKSAVVRALPVGDLVFYPDADLAPDQVEGWVWIRHDASQEAVFEQGEFGWVYADNIDTCG